jgi:hypothetical protein
VFLFPAMVMVFVLLHARGLLYGSVSCSYWCPDLLCIG